MAQDRMFLVLQESVKTASDDESSWTVASSKHSWRWDRLQKALSRPKYIEIRPHTMTTKK